MKVKVRRWRPVGGPPTDAYILWQVGKMPGECFERICLKHGKEKYLYGPSYHGEHCPSNGEHPGIECRCDECDYLLSCFGEELDLASMSDEELDHRLRELLSVKHPVELQPDLILDITDELIRRTPEPTPEELQEARDAFMRIFHPGRENRV